MRNRAVFAVAAALAVSLCVPSIAAKKKDKKRDYKLDAARVEQIAASLPGKPLGPGKPASDRAFWQTFAQDPAVQTMVAEAARIAPQPLPVQPDELFLEFSKNGNRRNFESVAFSRRNRLSPLVLAECVKNTGEFMPAIEHLVNELCKEKTWVLPAHDKKLTNFNGTKITIDLFSSNLAWQLAMADYLLGEKLSAATRENLRREVNRRVVLPFQQMVRDERADDYWFKTTNNWNPVCFSGATGAGLIQLESARDRAELIAAAEFYSRYFLSGFTKDGYCSEGVGYWSYGYGMFSLMAENFREATSGKVDLFKLPKAGEPAAFGARINIVDGIVPAFADCSLKAQPVPQLLNMLNKVYGWGKQEYAAKPAVGETLRSPFEAMLYYHARVTPVAPVPGADISGGAGLHTSFDEAGVFICRPASVQPAQLAVAFKGGNNGEQHNHNDIGSYVVVKGKDAVLVDPGPETYTARTFSSRRYESKLLNSFGHSVPVVDGKLQRTGSEARGVVLQKDFSDTTDTVVIDMTSAYEVPNLKKLTRKFEYGRGNGGVFIVTDHVEFSAPTAFETAVIGLHDFQVMPGGKRAVATGGAEKVNLDITATAPFSTGQEVIKENAPVEPRRLSIRLREPVSEATVTVRMK